MNRPPAFQFYPKDFLMDDKVVVMNLEEKGAYILLLCYSWNNNGLTKNQNELKTMCGNPENWEHIWGKVGKCFYEKKGKLYNKRLQKEFKKQKVWRKKSRLGGIQSGISRGKKVEPNGKNGSTKNEPKGNSSSSSSSSSTKKNIKSIGQDELDRLFDKWWLRYPKSADKGEAKKKWLTNVSTYGVDTQKLEDALTGYINMLNKNETPVFYIKHAKTFLYPGNKQKKIPPTWEQFLEFADPKYQAKPEY